IKAPPILKKPDMTITDIKFEPQTPKVGDLVKITISLKNLGEVATGNFTVEIDIAGIKKETLPQNFSLIANGTGVATYDLDTKAVAAGKYTVKATVDPLNLVKEENETNNFFTKDLELLTPPVSNIQISSFKIMTKDLKKDLTGKEVEEGTTVKIFVELENKGNAEGKATVVIGTATGKITNATKFTTLKDGNFTLTVPAGKKVNKTIEWKATNPGKTTTFKLTISGPGVQGTFSSSVELKVKEKPPKICGIMVFVGAVATVLPVLGLRRRRQ
ncbi:MAG: CARDB domain-containing protein, partial [Candidatus Thermoplasmatota archaeon]